VVSDAPLGLFLSGGMDSTALAALMRAAGVESIRSVSVRFEEEEYDEGEAARDVARRFGLEHTEIRVGSDEVLTALDRVIDSMDQPTVDGINTYFVSRAAREAGLTVALSGLGADELFGGYPTFQSVPRTQRIMRDLRRLPGHRALLPLAVRAPGMPRSARKLVTWTNGTSSLPAAYAAVRGLLAPDEVRALGGEEVFDPGRYVDLSVDLHGLEPAVAVSALESRIYMHNQLLRDTDAMSMANSLEVRVPFLDQEVVELAARSRSLLGRPRKPALSAARAIYFPLAGEPKTKRSFTFPLDRWLRGPFGRQLEAETSPVVLSSQGLHGLFEEVRAGRRHWSQVWAPVVLSRWLEARGVTA
jgi:asparagine synthase (glutamine-hydrolysing)